MYATTHGSNITIKKALTGNQAVEHSCSRSIISLSLSFSEYKYVCARASLLMRRQKKEEGEHKKRMLDVVFDQ